MITKLKARRFLSEISQHALARESGIAQSRISLFENNLANPSIKEKELLAKVLGTIPEELFPGT